MVARGRIDDVRRLGRSDLSVTSVGLGIWAWGDTQFWGYGEGYHRKDLDETWRKNLELGVNFIDTAEIYGNGASETILGELLEDTKEELIIATKVLPTRPSADTVRPACEASLERMGLETIDLYQVHWPPDKMPLSELMREMERLVDDGLVRYIGVSNFTTELVDEAQSYLDHAKIVSNQIHYSLLQREPETTGVVEHHRRNHISIIAYSPLEQGILTGKYTPSNLPGGFRAEKPIFSPKNLRRVFPLLKVLWEIGEPRRKTMAQVAMAWLLKDSNVVVIPGAKNTLQVEENIGSADFHLTFSERALIESAYDEYKQAGGV
jgi:aryl-alcohol dehydrogenase-like predicted oxidoreductase